MRDRRVVSSTGAGGEGIVEVPNESTWGSGDSACAREDENMKRAHTKAKAKDRKEKPAPWVRTSTLPSSETQYFTVTISLASPHPHATTLHTALWTNHLFKVRPR
jgi:hypothetical protein